MTLVISNQTIEDEYADGYDSGRMWAEDDRKDHMTPHAALALFRSESQTDQRWARAFYLGALRGYREVVRSLRAGRWGT